MGDNKRPDNFDELSDDEKIDIVAKEVLEKYKKAKKILEM